jgi:hypothetical protein
MKNIILLILAFASLSSAQYSLSVENIGGAKHAGETNLFRATLLKEGAAVYTIERTIPFDVPFPATYCNSTTGISVVSYIMDGFVEVYDAAGEKAWEQNFFKGMGPNYERTITVAVGKSSIVFLTSDVTLPHATLRKYSMDGAAQWETTLPYAMGYEIAMSDNERTIVAGSYLYDDGSVKQSAMIVRGDGSVAGNAAFLFRKAAFSPDGRMIGLISNEEAAVVDANNGTIIGRQKRKTEGVITDLMWNGTTLIVQESKLLNAPQGSFFYKDPTLIVYSVTLSEISRRSITTDAFKTSSLTKAGTDIIFSDGKNSLKISVEK